MKLSDLKPYKRNPRKITDEQLFRLGKSLTEFGDLSGIVFNRRTGSLVGGHQRLKCLPPDAVIEKIELKEPSRTGTVAHGFITIANEKFIYREVDWDETKEKAANIAANKHGGEFDDEQLSELLRELENEGIDFDVVGFDDEELQEIWDSFGSKSGQIDDDEVPEINIPEPITKIGDLYILGRHRLLCGDSTKIEDVERLMNGEKADMVFTDPPYGINIVKGVKKNGYVVGFVGGEGVVKPRLYKPIIGDDNTFDPSFLLNLANKIIIWGANNFSSKLPDSKGWLVWDKKIPSDATFSMCELAWTNIFGHIKKYDYHWAGMIRTGSRKEELLVRVHPTQKPVGLLSAILLDMVANTILDPFLGSGSTLIACEKTNRICYGMEIDPHYCDVIVTRWCKYTGINKIIKNDEEIEWNAD